MLIDLLPTSPINEQPLAGAVGSRPAYQLNARGAVVCRRQVLADSTRSTAKIG